MLSTLDFCLVHEMIKITHMCTHHKNILGMLKNVIFKISLRLDRDTYYWVIIKYQGLILYTVECFDFVIVEVIAFNN